MLTPIIRAQIDRSIAKFPQGRQGSAVIEALRIVQKANGGHLNKACLDSVADYLSVSRVIVREVATFYTLYHLQPIGHYKISVCQNISCMLCGAECILAHLERRLGIKVGETTADGKFTLVKTECLAACTRAPALQINDEVYYGNMRLEGIDALLEELGQEWKE